ncbi:hypothetical protein V7111_07345 [Neobacillus niacini]|uniref:hypothetical protein n=1 Tax=Neobacillus niacini TaxID=86668 RepID=UPI00300063D5
MQKTINEMEEEFEYFRRLMVVKLKDQELDSESLDRMIEQVYWLGHFVGRCRERHYQEVSNHVR